VSNCNELKNTVLKEMHNMPYDGHPRYQKTIAAIRSQYVWSGMKKKVVNYISKCLKCQKVKIEHRNPVGIIYPLSIPKWKWEVVTIYFITKFPKIVKQPDSIMLVVDKLTKDAHFIPMNNTHKAENIVDIYMKRVAKLHGVPKEIVSDIDPKITSNFWKGLFKGFGTNLNLSTTYHPELDQKIERTNIIVEDMLKMCVMD